jgi:hypothetical protein
LGTVTVTRISHQLRQDGSRKQDDNDTGDTRGDPDWAVGHALIPNF